MAPRWSWLAAVLVSGWLCGAAWAQPAQPPRTAQSPAVSVCTGNRIGDSPAMDAICGRGVIRVGINPDFKPFSFMNDEKRRSGIDIRIAKLLAQQMGVKLKLVAPLRFSALIPMLLDGQIDIVIAAMSRTFSRTRYVDFTIPYFHTGIGILLNKAMGHELGISQAADYRSLVQLLKKTGNAHRLIVAAVDGKSPADTIPRYFPEAIVRLYDSNEAAAMAVSDNRAHIMVHDEVFLRVWMREHRQLVYNRLTVFEKPYRQDAYGFAVPKGNPGWLKLLDSFISDKLLAEGYLDEFMQEFPL
jgi:polar amino acid transport system substrate-binding protein